MRGYRKDKNPIANAFKGVGRAIGEGMEAMAEAARIEEERQLELRQIEAGYRSTVEDALREYEKHVGRPYQLDSRFTTARVEQPILNYNAGLIWDLENKGHLVTCRDNCVTDHCIACGMESYGQVYCGKHRP